MTAVTMHTHVENPTTECPKSGCIEDRDDNITCKIGTVAGTKRQTLPVMSADSATHTVTVTVQKGTTSLPAIPATVGSPVSTSGPSTPICP